VRAGILCPVEQAWSPLLPAIALPESVPEAWQMESRFQEMLPPVSLMDAFAPEIRYLANLPSQFAAQRPPEMSPRPSSVPELEALREQQERFLERIVNFAGTTVAIP
jgi:hypothetical protein